MSYSVMPSYICFMLLFPAGMPTYFIFWITHFSIFNLASKIIFLVQTHLTLKRQNQNILFFCSIATLLPLIYLFSNLYTL